MVTLTIKKADGSTYWTEYFNDQAACDKWLNEEMTRPYWKSTYTAVSVSSVPSAIDDSALKAKRLAAIASLSTFDATKFKAADAAAILDNIVTALGAK